jgi:hypothetical protein
LQDSTFNFINTKKYVGIDEIQENIRTQGITSLIDLNKEDIQSIVDTLEYDGVNL